MYRIFHKTFRETKHGNFSQFQVLTFAEGPSCIQKVIAIHTQDKDLLDNSPTAMSSYIVDTAIIIITLSQQFAIAINKSTFTNQSIMPYQNTDF